MTVAEIRKYIDYQVNEMIELNRENYSLDPLNVKTILDYIKSMLDELEERPKAHWKYNKDNFIGVEYSNCNHYFFFDDLPIKEHLEMMNYCANCGERMNRSEL